MAMHTCGSLSIIKVLRLAANIKPRKAGVFVLPEKRHIDFTFLLKASASLFVYKNYWIRKHTRIDVQNCYGPKETFLGRGR